MRIEVDALGSRRSGRRVFEGVSFALDAGQALVVTGRNGAGKSTLLAILAGSLNADQGRVAVSDAGERTLPECLHLVGHRDGLKAALTARENLSFAGDLLGDAALSPEDALDAVGLAHAAALPVAYLSAGQRRRVALARLLVARRPLWLLDEPTATLDAPAQERLLTLMHGHLATGGLLIAATHAPLDLPGATELRLQRDSFSVQAQAERSEPGERRVVPPEATKPDGGGWRAFRALVARDLKLAARIGGSGVLGLVFFLMLVTLVPFALGPDLNLLSRVGPAILWLAAVLATLIGLDRLFQADEEDGSLDLLRAAPAPLEVLVLAKVVAHWLTTGLPLALASPLFGLLVALTPTAMAGTAVTLLVGTPALTFIGAIGAALTGSIRRGGLILALLVLPLMIPTLIFGVSAANAATGGTIPFSTPLLVLGALSLIAGVVSTVAAAAALRYGE